MSQLQVNQINDASGGVLAPISSVMRNRIINGSMVLDQRNAGASVTPTGSQYTLDRWNANLSQSSKFSVQQQTSVVPIGFNYATKITSLSAYTVGAGELFSFEQPIEGYNTADLGWGTANAKTITISFWVYSSLTGTFGGALNNSANNRSYPFSYTISSANTWEQKSITIAGDTSGTWLTTNGIGVMVRFGLGVGSTFSGTAGAWAGSALFSATGATSVVGTDGATFYITGVQLEVGTQATSFEYRQYTTELQLCQRYLPKFSDNYGGQGQCAAATQAYIIFKFPVTTRTAATGIVTSGGIGQTITNSAMGNVALTAATFSSGGVDSGMVFCSVASGLTAGDATTYNTNGGIIYFTGCEL
jgi:hypothetical protein